MGKLFEDKEHLVRMAGLFAVGIVVFLVLRGVLVPADFGELGHYRTSAIDDNRSVLPQFAGREACEACHDGVAEERASSAHRSISCETCHGALAAHADDPGAVMPELPESTPLCVGCHEMNAARPSWFPQVNGADHADGSPCDDCHLPHHPEIEL